MNKSQVGGIFIAETKLLVVENVVFRKEIKESFVDEFFQYFRKAWKNRNRSIVGEKMTVPVFEDGRYSR